MTHSQVILFTMQQTAAFYTVAFATLYFAGRSGLKKVGGIWFFRIGRIRLSFCVARAVAAETIAADR